VDTDDCRQLGDGCAGIEPKPADLRTALEIELPHPAGGFSTDELPGNGHRAIETETAYP